MTEPAKPRRRRLRFTLRTLAIVVTLVSVYIGLWAETNRACKRPMRTTSSDVLRVRSAWSPMPLFVVQEEDLYFVDGGPLRNYTTGQERYYVCLFGWDALIGNGDPTIH